MTTYVCAQCGEKFEAADSEFIWTHRERACCSENCVRLLAGVKRSV